MGLKVSIVKTLGSLPWHKEFTWAKDSRVFTVIDDSPHGGPYRWVQWHDEHGLRHTGEMHIGEEVTPL